MRSVALRQHVRATDVLGIGVAAVQLGAISREKLADCVSLWESPAQFVCKPIGYTTFDEFFEHRLVQEAGLLDG